jgi:ATPase subunit of ABC transporter with duplicated ATPase domains
MNSILWQKRKKENHKSLMREQERAKKSKLRGQKLAEQKRYLPAVADLKASYASKTAGKKNSAISAMRENLNERLSDLQFSENIKPSFSLSAKEIQNKIILSISGGCIGYGGKIILSGINLSLAGGERLAITGKNGCGKTTLMKALLNCAQIVKEGLWETPKLEDIGYLDQNYNLLDNSKTVFEEIKDIAPHKTAAEIRDHLNDFLFRKNEEVNKKVSFLSGGERAKLTLAKIALKTPKLLLIDEITNNIDLETKESVAEVLTEYPGALLIISHDSAFLE